MVYGGYRLWLEKAIEGAHFSPVVPGEVNLLGIDPGAGYKIIVANYVAQLVEASDKFQGNGNDQGGATEGSIKKRIPIKEMLAVLRGDEKALGPLTMTMNEMKEDLLPPIRIVWSAEDLHKAFSGDAAKRNQLEQDLNVHINGMPLDKVRPASIENGIVVDVPVKVKVNLAGTTKEVVGHVLMPYKPRLIQTVESQYADKNYNREMQAGYYKTEAETIQQHPDRAENIQKSLLSMISDETGRRLAEPVERVLRSATVIVNESHIKSASYRTYDTSDGLRNDLTVEMTDEGRQRLWKYSHDKVGTQILLVADGVAIEAPRIQHVLAEGELTITQMRDKVLVKDAVDKINKHTKVQSN
ncbi:hypothetical protein OP10G_3065 [Fimbriimonas ginsengisoli Gsoil 348]|uniref:Uncharacterized protein n=1 Tax=Fimbriimonas ginsengisoli Gsoil 348 TaxID=661478 RepID=A0A068NSB0_FIMGI|nr:hypothetical protein OP10G_3065 [Fimbriimonas ginsengisoli Gsoil 348]